LRTVVWPCLVVIAVYAIARTSTYIEDYLHTSPKDLQAVATWVLPAAAFGLAAVLASVISPALIIFRLRIVENTLRFLGLIGFIVLLSFWLFSLALTLIDLLLSFTGATTDRHPFSPPSFATYISLGALLLFGLFFILRRNRSSQSAPAAEVATSRVSQAPGEAGTRSQL
jgi:hypothetical protein